MIILKKIISGGQTGADIGGLLAARKLGLETGGWMPKGFLTEDGPKPWLQAWNLSETSDTSYPPRTRRNIEESDGTVIFSQTPLGRGSRLTMRLALKFGKPYLLLTPKETSWELFNASQRVEFIQWLERNKIAILNVAGSRESKDPGIELRVRDFIVLSLEGKINGAPHQI